MILLTLMCVRLVSFCIQFPVKVNELYLNKTKTILPLQKKKSGSLEYYFHYSKVVKCSWINKKPKKKLHNNCSIKKISQLDFRHSFDLLWMRSVFPQWFFTTWDWVRFSMKDKMQTALLQFSAEKMLCNPCHRCSWRFSRSSWEFL